MLGTLQSGVSVSDNTRPQDLFLVSNNTSRAKIATGAGVLFPDTLHLIFGVLAVCFNDTQIPGGHLFFCQP